MLYEKLNLKKNNSTFSTTDYTRSTKFLFQKYKKVSKIGVKLGSFLHCSAHIFLGNDGCL